jgi:class 3 adenylate cyclase/Tfp pilus assembly protein PilX
VLRIGVPVLGVVLMIAVILTIAIETTRANRRGALELADDVLAAADARIAGEVTGYFAVPLRALEEGVSLAEHEAAGAPRRALVEKFSTDVLKHVPQIADFIIGDSEGDFIMVRRGESGGTGVKVIDNAPGARKVLWIRTDAGGKEIGREEDPTDTFDPRTRPWYAGALATTGVYWTDVYVFFTAKEPGITASTRYQTPEGRDFVVGVDITLADLSRFLAALKIGDNGRAMLIGDQGRVIAYPQAESVVQHDSAEPVTARVHEVGDEAAAGAYDRFRVDGPGRKTITVDGSRYLTALTPLQTVGRDWSVLIVAPEKDFIGFVEHNNRVALVMSLAIVTIATLMAALLVRQGLRGDRAARLVRERSRAMARQSEALDLVADEADLFDRSHPEPPEALTETAAEITHARRASLWYLLPGGDVLRCADSFDSETSRHTSGMELHYKELPQCFRQVAAGATIDVADAAHDPRTAEVHRLLMAPLGSRSLSIVPMRRRGHAVGTIWLEDALDDGSARHFLRILASMAALRAIEGATGSRATAPEVATAVAEAESVRSLSADLTLRGLDATALGKALYPEVAVLVMRVDNPASTANGVTDTPKLLDAVVQIVQEVADEQQIPYLKLVGYDIIGAAGFSPDDPTAVSRIANVAVACRDRLIALFEESGSEPYFRLGIDCGIAFGQALGSNPRVFNLWGEAVRTAQVMAASALPGAIQTSEAVYRRLRQGFLLRPRGTFYLPPVGTAQTFVLAGRL